jgi:hypothetical protein
MRVPNVFIELVFSVEAFSTPRPIATKLWMNPQKVDFELSFVLESHMTSSEWTANKSKFGVCFVFVLRPPFTPAVLGPVYRGVVFTVKRLVASSTWVLTGSLTPPDLRGLLVPPVRMVCKLCLARIFQLTLMTFELGER